MNRGERLKNIIEEKGYSVMSLSRESGVPYTTIRSMIERNLTNASIGHLSEESVIKYIENQKNV